MRFRGRNSQDSGSTAKSAPLSTEAAGAGSCMEQTYTAPPGYQAGSDKLKRTSAPSDGGEDAERRPSAASASQMPKQHPHFQPLLVTTQHLEELRKAAKQMAAAGKEEAVHEGRRVAKELTEAVHGSLQQAISEAVEALERRLGERLEAARGTVEEAKIASDAALQAHTAALREEVLAQHRELWTEAGRHSASTEALIAALRDDLARTRDTFDARCKAALDGRLDLEREIRGSEQEHGQQLGHLREALQRELAELRAEMRTVDTRLSGSIAQVAQGVAAAGAAQASLEGRLVAAERRTGQLRKEAEELERLPTRRVDLVVRRASRLLQGTQDRGWISPGFGAGGCPDLRLELRLAATPSLEEEGRGDWSLLLWGRKGFHARVKLHFGTFCQELDHCFDQGTPCVMEGCRLQDALDASDDTLRLGVEVLEGYSLAEGAPLALRAAPRPEADPADEQDELAMPALTGSFFFYRYHCPTAMERIHMLEAEWEQLRSRIVGRVEWRIEQATMLQQCFARGACLCSATFSAAGLSDLQLVFYPSGDKETRELYCGLFLHAPGQEAVQCWLSIGKQRREALGARDRPGFFGRSNFCLFEGSVDKGSDTLTVALEVSEAQLSLAPTPRAAPWPGVDTTPMLLDTEGYREVPERGTTGSTSYKEVIRSLSRLQGVPGRMAIEDVKQLPAIWSATLHRRPRSLKAKPGLRGRGNGSPGALPEGFRPFADLAAAVQLPQPTAESTTSPPRTPRAKGIAAPCAPVAVRLSGRPDPPLPGVSPPRRGRVTTVPAGVRASGAAPPAPPTAPAAPTPPPEQ